MNAITPIGRAHADTWEDAAKRFNAWRGEAIHCFTCIELAVGKALLALTDGTGHGRMLGVLFKALETALGKDPAEEKALNRLKALAPMLDDRIALCHGTAKIAVDRQGAWIVRLQWIDFVKKPSEHERIWDEEGAAEYLKDLRKRSGDIRSVLGQLGKPKPAPNPAPASTPH